MASRSLGQLTLDLVAKIGAFTGPLDKAARHTKKRSDEIAAFASRMGPAVAAGLAAAAAAITAATLKVTADLSRLKDSAAAAAIGVETFQAWGYAAEQAGVSSGQFESAMRRAALTIGQAVEGSDRARRVFQQLGVAVLDVNGNVRSTEAVVRDYAQKIAALGNANQAAAASAALFGREAGPRMAVLLAEGSAGLEAMEADARALGIVIDESLVNAAEEFGDQLDTIKKINDAALANALSGLIPIFSGIAEKAVEASRGINLLSAGFQQAALIQNLEELREELENAPEVAAKRKRLPSDFIYEWLGFNLTDTTRTKAKVQSEIDDILAQLDRLKGVKPPEVAPGEVLQPKGDTEAADKRRLEVMKELEETSQLVAETIERTEQAMADAQQRTNMQAQGIRDSLRTEEEAILESYERRRQIVLDNTLYTGEAQTELLRRLEEQRDEQLLELNAGFWERYLKAAEENLTTLDQVTADLLNNVSSQFGNAFESMIFDAESLGDAMRGLAEDMLRSVVNAIGQMIAQWLAMQAVQMLIGRTTEAAAIAGATATGAAVAAAYAPAAALASLASFGANAAPAIAGMAATAATAQGLALVGMAHDGIDRVPKTGTWLLEKGERVMSGDTSARLDAMLTRIGGGGAPVVNIQNAPPGNHVATTRRGADGQMVIDVLLADIQSDGPASRAISGSYGLRRRGR